MRKRILSLLLSLALLLTLLPATVLTVRAEGYSGVCGAAGDNLKWNLNTENGTLTITGSGMMADFEMQGTDIPQSTVPWFGKRDLVKTVSLSDGVTGVGNYAFYECINLTSATIPSSVESIGDYSFAGCSAMESIILPSGLTHIGEGAFCRTILASISIPFGVVSVGDYAFSGCSNLISVTLPNSVAEIGGYAFSGTGLTEVTIPTGMTRIGRRSFSGCTALSAVTIPNGITKIESYAFADCTSLLSVVIPASVQQVTINAFPAETELIYERTLCETDVEPVDTGLKTALVSRNIGKETYQTRSGIIDSYLYPRNGFLYRLEYMFENLYLEKYTTGGQFIGSWSIPMELSIFGGFYAGKDAFYIVFGQNNTLEDDDVEVLRVVKYNLDWKRLGKYSLYGGNTSTQFRAGSLRMTEDEDCLYIRTCHEMYRSSDGKHHQANMTLVLDKERLILREGSWIVGGCIGFVSHSFNQFIMADGDEVYAVDHGDANPARSIMLFVCGQAEIASGSALPKHELFSIGGSKGENYTGVSVGGLELSDSHCLVVFNSIDQANFSESTTRNVWLSAVDRDTLSVKNTQLTAYPEGSDVRPGTPELVKISSVLFAVMWREYDYKTGLDTAVRVLFCDGSGTQLGTINSFNGSLSDCQPIVADGRVTWYVTDGECLRFYSFKPVQTGATVRIEDYKEDRLNGTITPPDPCAGYTDIDRNSWYHSSADFVISHGYMGSTSATTLSFNPNGTITRAMLVTILYRLEGSPAVNGSSPFTDVTSENWYTDAVIWASENEIVSGYGNGSFGPADQITREQFATIMYRYAGYVGYNTSGAADLSGYQDAAQVSSWALRALSWANKEGLIRGISTTQLAPRGSATRSQAAAILMRFIFAR